MPPVMEALVTEGIRIDGFIAPGHVCAITGSGIFNSLSDKFKLGVVVSGFEPVDILQSILMLVRQLEESRPGVEIQYKRVVRTEGNPVATGLIRKVFEPADDEWRGIGTIKNSGLKLREEFSVSDAVTNIPVKVGKSLPPRGCICGEVLKGVKRPSECRLFGKVCTPLNPVGACMVSGEGACGVYYKHAV
jgi:hydrogenase expression/formation protein HypD